MLGEEDKDRFAGAARKRYLRSVSWTDRSPTKPANSNPRPQANSKARSCLPPLQPLSITRRNVEEWPRAGSDDLGVWPHPQTPRGSVMPPASSNPEQAVREFQCKRDKLAFFDKECSRIADHIYLGSDTVAKNREILRQNGITHVLNCVGFVCPEYFKIDLVYKTLWLQDSPSEDITSVLYDVFDYFEDVRERGGRVLVHCCQGVSRSTSLVIAYLMWREGQSFEDALKYVKAARGVSNPNMGFTCQLLQCQKRVHAVPASPNSMLRMYRMAPHSPYDPLHLVPKTVSYPGIQALDSRGAFVVHVPSALFVWNGKNCNVVMSNNAGAAAFQVIRYERAKGPILNIKEGEEPPEFWAAFAIGQSSADDCNLGEVRKEDAGCPGSVKLAAEIGSGIAERKVDAYDLDFELFYKAIAGGVVPPFSVSNTGSETCLPARENGWSRLRQKFAVGNIKELITSSELNCDTAPSSDVSNMDIDNCKEEEEQPVSLVDPSSPLSPSTHLCGSPDSFECFPHGSPDRIPETCKQVEQLAPLPYPFSPPSCGSPDSFSRFPGSSPKFSSKSPTLSPSTSDYASSFSFSPSSSNWSDLSYLSSQQPSPSGLDSTDPFSMKNISLLDNANIFNKQTSPTPPETFYANQSFRTQTAGLPGKGLTPSIAERRGSNPPPRMLLSSVDESPQVPRNLARSWSFSIPDVDDDVMKDLDYSQSEDEDDGEEVMLDVNIFSPGNELQSEIKEKEERGKIRLFSGKIIDQAAEVMNSVLYKWPSLNKIEGSHIHELDSGSAYMLLAQEASLGSKNSRTLTFWLGRETLHEKGQHHGDKSESGVLHWEKIARNCFSQMDLPSNTPVRVVREGEEPEQFLNHLRCLA
ncbi:Atypical dual specificity phosphatase, subfamily A [Parasponia andersonii]|uniref:Atypical dual specificity phosphatase, subfamily A n=1 Tax=Parasponia andersonii TaxID=3476 RepID=A0A2P5CTD0_PARAD|nr:Atypical dual specificity phosphatase, subfamily A [Parasponia andersonii]